MCFVIVNSQEKGSHADVQCFENGRFPCSIVPDEDRELAGELKGLLFKTPEIRQFQFCNLKELVIVCVSLSHFTSPGT
jgi:hypothetical protein